MAALPAPLGDDPWADFALDPRQSVHATMRASDADRDVAYRMLTTAFVEGRLDRVELDTRTELVARSKTLGELPPALADLVPLTPGRAPRDVDLTARAEAAYRQRRAQALWAFLSTSAIVWVIWAVTSGVPSFPWPVFVSLGTGMGLARTLFMRRHLVAEEIRRLEKKAAKQARALPPSESGA